MIEEEPRIYVPTQKILELKWMSERVRDNPFISQRVKESQQVKIAIYEEVLEKRKQDEFGER